MLRPVSMRIRQASALHYGADRELMTSPLLIAVDSPAGRSIDVQIRNNSPEIRSFTLVSSCEGLELAPAKTDVSIGGSLEREVSVRVFGNGAESGVHKCLFRLSGAALLETAATVVVIPRDKTVSYNLDLDADGAPEYVIESQHLRAVFSQADGGRWKELLWKDSNRNVLPETGIELGKAAIELRGSELSVERATGPLDSVPAGKYGETTLTIQHPSATKTVFSFRRDTPLK
jgi:hypothetical protein